MQDFYQRLKEHLLPRIAAVHQRECFRASLIPENSSYNAAVFVKGNRIFQHHQIEFNYTTYDVQRSGDVIRPRTNLADIMLLADDESAEGDGRFLYARVLGAYHANVRYVGPSQVDSKYRRIDFLWVRWYEWVNRDKSGWDNFTLQALSFPPVHGDHSFGFVDPHDVLRAAHIMPAFAHGRRREGDIGLSDLARDSDDWKLYYVGRCES